MCTSILRGKIRGCINRHVHAQYLASYSGLLENWIGSLSVNPCWNHCSAWVCAGWVGPCFTRNIVTNALHIHASLLVSLHVRGNFIGIVLKVLVFKQVKVLTVCQSKIADSEEGREIFFVFIVLLFFHFLHTIGFHSSPPPRKQERKDLLSSYINYL